MSWCRTTSFCIVSCDQLLSLDHAKCWFTNGLAAYLLSVVDFCTCQVCAPPWKPASADLEDSVSLGNCFQSFQLFSSLVAGTVRSLRKYHFFPLREHLYEKRFCASWDSRRDRSWIPCPDAELPVSACFCDLSQGLSESVICLHFLHNQSVYLHPCSLRAPSSCLPVWSTEGATTITWQALTGCNQKFALLGEHLTRTSWWSVSYRFCWTLAIN